MGRCGESLGQISGMLIFWGQGRGRGVGTDIGDVNIGGLGTDMGMFILWVVGEFWDRHSGC